MTFSKYIKWFSIIVFSTIIGACGGDAEVNKDLDDTQTYKADSPYVGTIENCVRAESAFCSLTDLPLIGMLHNNATIEQLLERVVVSHSWMGVRFEEVLREMPTAMLPLFNSITAIVIDSHIRPSYYSSDTGALYLDPAILWLSLDEKGTISAKQDYRNGFDNPLAFRQVQRYVKGGQLAYPYASITDDSTRALEDITHLVARVLLHELAHANDFIPPNSYALLDSSLSVSEAAGNFSNQWVSTLLSDAMPLESETLYSLADVLYSGITPSFDDLELDAATVGMAFEPDGASDDYSYTTQFEDVAMLFEVTMMKYFFGMDYEMAFTRVPEDPTQCDNYHIGWGVRNRIGDTHVLPRAQFVVEELLPNLDFDAFFNELEAPTDLSGDWCLISQNADGTQVIINQTVDPEQISRLPYL